MKKQNLYIIVTVLLAATLMVGCEKNDTVASGTTPSNTSSVEPIVTTASVSSDPVTATPVVIDNPDVTVPDNGNDDNGNQQVNVPEEDPYEVLFMDEERAKEAWFALLKKGNSTYSLGFYSNNQRNLYHYRDDDTVFSCGNEYPIPTFEEGDSIYGYTSDGSVPKLTLRKATVAAGYTIPIVIEDDGDVFLIDLNGNDKIMHKLDIRTMEITDEDGNQMDMGNLENLTKDNYYSFGWYEGINYEGFDLVANSLLYKLEGEEIAVPGEITKEGYLYDLSGVEPGLYCTNDGGFVTVK